MASNLRPPVSSLVLRMKLIGANPHASVTALDELPGKSSYFIGNDPSKWRTNLPNYAKVKVEGVYPGIDLVYNLLVLSRRQAAGRRLGQRATLSHLCAPFGQ